MANQSETKSHVIYYTWAHMNISPSLPHIHTFAQLDLLQISHTNMIRTEIYKPFIVIYWK